MEGNIDDVIRSGWVDKKSMRSLRKTGFIRRFMVLTSTRLFYLASEPSASYRDEIHFEVKLDIVNDILNRDYHEKGLGKFDIVTPSRHLTIKCSFDEKLLWIRDIQVARDALLCINGNAGKHTLYKSVVPTTSHTPGVGKKLKTLFRGGTSGSEQEGGGSETFTFEQARALSELHDFICSSTDLCATIITAVFESLNALNKQEKSKVAKQLGQVLAMWLGESADQEENSRRASRLSVSHAGKPSQIEILTIWLEISLVREFKESCSFAPKVWTYATASDDEGENEEGRVKNEADSMPSGNGETKKIEKENMKEEKEDEKTESEAAVTNIPFRRDNIECLFILSFIKSVAQNTGMLSTWLMPSLLVISQNPESFLPVKPTSSSPPTPPPSSAGGVDEYTSSLAAGGLAILSSLRNLTISSNLEDNYRISIANSPSNKIDIKTHNVDNDDGLDDDNDAVIVSRVFKLTPQDFFHLEAVKIIDKMKRTELLMPPSFKLLIATIFRLTVKTSDFYDREVVPARNISNGNEHDKEVKITRKYESQAEFGVYYASACATLFLRLICPALLCPLEWGVLSQKTLMNFQPKTQQMQQLHSLTLESKEKKEKKREVLKRFVFGKKREGSNTSSIANCGTSHAEVTEQTQRECISDMNNNPAAAAIILVAHILSHCNLEEFWSSSDIDLDNFEQIQSNVVRLIPIEKLDAFVHIYEAENCQSVVDPSTRSTFESPPVRKGLMGLAKDIQRLANLSIAPLESMEAQAEGVYTRLHSTHGDDPPTGEEFAKEVDFQVQQARKIQALYNSLGHSSQYVSWELEDELGR